MHENNITAILMWSSQKNEKKVFTKKRSTDIRNTTIKHKELQKKTFKKILKLNLYLKTVHWKVFRRNINIILT